MPTNGPPVDERMFRVIDAMVDIAAETGRFLPQIALNWVLQRPTVASVIVGARNEAQLWFNLGAVGWSLTDEQKKRLHEASAVMPIYPYWRQRRTAGRNRSPV